MKSPRSFPPGWEPGGGREGLRSVLDYFFNVADLFANPAGRLLSFAFRLHIPVAQAASDGFLYFTFYFLGLAHGPVSSVLFHTLVNNLGRNG